jgi:hypothetical protein
VIAQSPRPGAIRQRSHPVSLVVGAADLALRLEVVEPVSRRGGRVGHARARGHWRPPAVLVVPARPLAPPPAAHLRPATVRSSCRIRRDQLPRRLA